MTSTSDGRATLVPRTAVPGPGRVGQGTAVEQSRAVAEVHAAIVVAQQVPRDIDRAVRDMYRSCAQKSLAEKAFFRYRRGDGQVSGSSVQLARELARCWGNIQYGLTELRRDDIYGQSEMQAWAWDVQTNARSSTTFIVPHRRDRSEAKGGSVALTDMRDIYENNANMGARRLREMIFAILPGWLSEDAVAACYETLASDDSDGDLPQRRAKAAERFAAISVTGRQLEQRLGAPQGKWTPYDLAQLSVVYRSLMRGETRKEDEFGDTAGRVTAADITGEPEPSGPAAPGGHVERADPAAGPETKAPAARDDTTSGTRHAAAVGNRAEGPAAPAGEGGRTSADPRAAGATSARGAQPPAPQGQPQPAPKGMLLKLDRLLGQLQLGPDPDVKALLDWLCGEPYTATRGQVQLATTWLEDHLNACQGDVSEAFEAIWAQHRAATALDAAEAGDAGEGAEGGA